jgi:predicted membrane metal-binding protein
MTLLHVVAIIGWILTFVMTGLFFISRMLIKDQADLVRECLKELETFYEKGDPA